MKRSNPYQSEEQYKITISISEFPYMCDLFSDFGDNFTAIPPFYRPPVSARIEETNNANQWISKLTAILKDEKLLAGEDLHLIKKLKNILKIENSTTAGEKKLARITRGIFLLVLHYKLSFEHEFHPNKMKEITEDKIETDCSFTIISKLIYNLNDDLYHLSELVDFFEAESSLKDKLVKSLGDATDEFKVVEPYKIASYIKHIINEIHAALKILKRQFLPNIIWNCMVFLQAVRNHNPSEMGMGHLPKDILIYIATLTLNNFVSSEEVTFIYNNLARNRVGGIQLIKRVYESPNIMAAINEQSWVSDVTDKFNRSNIKGLSISLNFQGNIVLEFSAHDFMNRSLTLPKLKGVYQPWENKVIISRRCSWKVIEEIIQALNKLAKEEDKPATPTSMITTHSLFKSSTTQNIIELPKETHHSEKSQQEKKPDSQDAPKEKSNPMSIKYILN